VSTVQNQPKYYCPKDKKMLFLCESKETTHPICQGCHTPRKDKICPYWITKEEHCKGVSSTLPNFICPRYGDYKQCGRYTLIIDLEYRKYEHERLIVER